MAEPGTGPTSFDATDLARLIWAARARGRTLTPITDSRTLSMAQAYDVQDQITALRLGRGERVVGWKLGYTSVAMREQMGVDEPNQGPLTDAMLLPSGASVPDHALQPRVEPEIGLRLSRRLAGPTTTAEALAACSDAIACLEVVDSVWTRYQFRIQDNTADGSSAAWVVVGAALPMDDLPSVRVSLSRDGVEVATAVGAAAGGHPASGVGWLAGQLALRGHALQPGDLVITGGLTAAIPLDAGSLVAATFLPPGTGAPVTVSVAGPGRPGGGPDGPQDT